MQLSITSHASLFYLLVFSCLISTCHGQTDENATTETETETDADAMATCEMESLALNTNSEISAATTELLTTTKDAILGDFRDFCRIISLTCTADLSDFSQNFQTVCTNNGGTFYEQNFDLDCETDTISPIEIPGTVDLVRFPSCLGATCDVENLPPSILTIQNGIISDINTEVDAALGDNVRCQVGSGPSGSGAVSFYQHGMIVMGVISTTIVYLNML